MKKKEAVKNKRFRAFLQTRTAKIILGVLIFLVLLRIALPSIILHYANKTLAEMDGYYGHIEDIDVALLRGAYMIDSFYINKVDKKTAEETEFLSARSIDLSIEWGALFQGGIVGELVFDRPVMRFTENKVELKEVSQDTSDFRELLRDFMPVDVNRCEIREGILQYVDNTKEPNVDLKVTNLDAIARNLRNAYEENEVLPASLDATGNVYSGNMTLAMKMNPLEEDPTFDLNATVKNTDLTQMNDMFKAYGSFDVNQGRFDMYAEAATKDRKFKGYVKPLIRDLDVVSWKGQDKKDGFFQKIWESIVGGVGQLFENQKTERIATKINFTGDLEDPEVNAFETVVLILQNAFIRALQPSIENQINLAKVGTEEQKKEGFFKSLFKNDKDEDKDKKDKKEEKKDDKKEERKKDAE